MPECRAWIWNAGDLIVHWLSYRACGHGFKPRLPCWPVVVPGCQDAGQLPDHLSARQVSLFSGHLMYAMDDHSRFSILAA